MKILLDNGHGVETPGKRSPDGKFREYSYTREVAQKIVTKLLALGYDAERIVTEDKDITLGERCRRVNAFCNKLGTSNVIMVSIHNNAAGDGTKWMTGRGWSAYTTPGNTKSDKLAEFLYVEAKKSLPTIKMRTETVDGDSDIEANFYILKNTNCPAVLTESLFQDNKEEVEFLTSTEGKQKIIDLHVNGIINYIKSIK